MANKKVTKKKTATRAVGRPTTYDPKYCQMVIDVMSHGHSLTSFCADINIHKQTAHNWMKEHKEFLDAYKIAKTRCQRFWENLLLNTALGDFKGNLGAQVFWMKNRFRDDWKDRFEQEVQVQQLEPIVIEEEGGKTTKLAMHEVTDGSRSED